VSGDVKVVELDYAPRRLFLPYHNRTQRFAAMVAHRRCGKTVACVNDIIPKAASLKLQTGWAPGRYAYVGPYLSQAKDVAWAYLKRFAAPLIVDKNEGDLWVEIAPHRARIRIYGADNPDRLRGAYLDGGVLDEYADMRPNVCSSIIRPMLSDRLGCPVSIQKSAQLTPREPELAPCTAPLPLKASPPPIDISGIVTNK